MTLTRQEIDGITSGAYRIDCARMTLFAHDGKPRFTGAGEILRDEAGRLSLVLYAPEYVIGGDDIFPDGLKAGEFMPATVFYHLEAVDVAGRLWLAENVRPDVSGIYGAPGAVVRATIRELTHRGEPHRTSDTALLWLHFAGFHRIPLNAGTRTVTERAKGRSEAFRLDQWLLADDSIDLRFTTRDHGFELEARTAADHRTKGWDTRIEEALWFTLGQALEWDILVESRPDSYRAAIRSRRGDVTGSGFDPPIEYRGRDIEQHVARLFLSYLDFLRGYKETRYHPLSVLVRRAIRASTGSVEEYALALSVGVEAIVKQYFAEWGAEPDDVKKAVEAAMTHLSCGKGYASIRSRIEGCLGSIKGSSARTALRRLAKEGRVSPAGPDAWDALRNPAAHGDEYDMNVQDLVRSTDHVHRLFVELVLRIIRYSGPYTDHTTPGWPNVDLIEGSSVNAGSN